MRGAGAMRRIRYRRTDGGDAVKRTRGYMRHRLYKRLVLATGEVSHLHFEGAHFKEAGLPPMVLAGMPHLEALELINKWNRGCKQFVYWL